MIPARRQGERTENAGSSAAPDQQTTEANAGLGRREFIVLLSMIMALAAMGIDLMLPAFDEMREAFGLAPDSNEVARTVTAYLIGMASAPIMYGTLADRFGRKPVLYLGGLIYLIGAVGSALAPSLTVLLLTRFVWGIGAAGGRVVAISIIRDTQQGDQMARTMSYIMSVFILIPVFAPALGAVLISIGTWRWVFWAAAGLACVILVWSLRLQETLDPAQRTSVQWSGLRAVAVRVGSQPATLIPTLALTCLMGIMSSYLASSQLLISEVFDRGDQFPLVFGLVALALGAASFLNGRLVGRFGIRQMLRPVAALYLAAGLAVAAVAIAAEGRPVFWLFMPLLTAALASQMLLIPNLNTLAMGPVGDVAGTASAIIGTVSTAGGAIIGALVDQQLGATVTPLAIMVGVVGGTVLLLVSWYLRVVPEAEPTARA